MRGNFLYRRLGEVIIDWRKRKKYSQEELALLSDVDRTYLARIEEGKANPTIKTLHKLARILRVKIRTLLKGI